METVKMPRLGVTMKAGKVAKWLKREGDEVVRGEPLFELESEKSTVEIEAQSNGIMKKILIEEDVEVPINTLLAIIAEPGEEVDLTQYIQSATPAPVASAKPTENNQTRVAAAVSANNKAKVAPRARKLAQELGVALEDIQGTGAGGLITEQDVIQAAEQPSSLPVRETITLNHIKQAMSANMLNSWRNIPQFTQIVSVNMQNVLQVKSELEGISINDILIKVVGKVVDQLPIVNSQLVDNKVLVYEGVNISVAVATEQGLVVPVIRDVQSKSVNQLSKEMREIAQKARENQLKADDFAHGTITVSNLGHFGIETGTPIINNPQSTLVFAGAIQKMPVVNDNDEIIIAPIMKLSICFDHRFIDGVTAAQFTQAMKKQLESLGISDLV